MADLKDPIKFQFTFETLRADAEGECMLTLRLPAGELGKAARFAMMRDIVFEGTCVPVDAKTKQEPDRM